MRTEARPAPPALALGAAPAGRTCWLVTAACAAVALALRGYQLSRPGYLTGVTEYDDGVLFGNALRLVSGVIPYRDFAVVQPPGSMLLMAPVALLAKAAGTAAGLAAARLLTVGVDTADVILLSLLVRHRGPVAVLVACGGYAVYPDAIVAAHTFLLEPWLNLFCLAGALLAVDGDRPAADNRRLALGGAAFGFAAAVKIWALVPFGVLVAVLAVVSRRASTAVPLAGGAALGLSLPLLPFAVLAPGALARGVVVSQALRDAGGAASPLTRLGDLAGLRLLPGGAPPHRAELLALAAAAAAAWAGYVTARRQRRQPLTALDAYAVAGTAAVTAMFLLPRLYYPHYGAFAGPFLALTAALPLSAARGHSGAGPRDTCSQTARRSGGGSGGPAKRPRLAPLAAALGLAVIAAAAIQLRAESREYGNQSPAAAARLIPAGACVLTNEAAYTVAANRFYSSVPGCPDMVDSFGTLIAMTGGLAGEAPAAVVRPVVQLWQADLRRAQYVWITSGSAGQIPWTSQLSAYLRRHFRLIGLARANGPQPPGPLSPGPSPGLYLRR